ncbi:MAG: hypothetical protein JOY87_10355 [Candidatus Eremiobacteraeota bacterium]|nr:hypothetical protein [Candidatus Eremiobacteraeota bacterium]
MSKWEFWIDRGGTFTDVVARHPDGKLTTHKLLSENPERYRDAAIAGIKSVLGIPFDAPIPLGAVEAVKMGTTVATNALLERKGERTLLLINRGFADLPRIGNQARPRLFDLKITLPTLLYERVVEVPGRVAVNGEEIEPLDEAAVREALEQALRDGLQACAIALIHAWKYPEHEKRLAGIARAVGFAQVSASPHFSHFTNSGAAMTAVGSAAKRRSVFLRFGELGSIAQKLDSGRVGFYRSFATRFVKMSTRCPVRVRPQPR